MLQLDWALELSMAGRASYAVLLGVLLGLERQFHAGSAGMRTYGAVTLGACAFGLVPQHVAGAADPSSIAAVAVSGIGFLGAGIIIRDAGRTTGLTTAATIWASAAIGLATAFGMFVLATLTAAVTFVLLDHAPHPRLARGARRRPAGEGRGAWWRLRPAGHVSGQTRVEIVGPRERPD